MKFAVSIFFCACLAGYMGCSNCSKPIQYDFLLLVGQKTYPEYESLSIDQEYGPDKSIQVYSTDTFGEISVFLNGEFEMIFDKGSLSLGQDEGVIGLKGKITSEMKCILLRQIGADKWRMIDMKLLPPGELDLSYNLEKL